MNERRGILLKSRKKIVWHYVTPGLSTDSGLDIICNS